jgi:hypothetical protein
MSFQFLWTEYVFNDRWDISQKEVGFPIMEAMVREGWNTRVFTQALKDAGLSYRRESMLADYALANATEWSKDVDAYERGKAWYDSLEAYRDMHPGMTRVQAVDFMHNWANESFATLEDLADAEALEAKDYVPGS